MEYDMSPYITAAELFTEYLYQRGRELYTFPGMSQIQLYGKENWDILNQMKSDFCKLHGYNESDVNMRWAFQKGMREYTFKHLGFVPKVVKWE